MRRLESDHQYLSALLGRASQTELSCPRGFRTGQRDFAAFRRLIIRAAAGPAPHGKVAGEISGKTRRKAAPADQFFELRIARVRKIYREM
jgi:hypothetical protein